MQHVKPNKTLDEPNANNIRTSRVRYIDNKKEQPPANAGSIFVCIALNNSAVNVYSLWSLALNVELVEADTKSCRIDRWIICASVACLPVINYKLSQQSVHLDVGAHFDLTLGTSTSDHDHIILIMCKQTYARNLNSTVV